ncbi:MAG: hypothetical protein HZB38_15265 [Planctomycetes bacterium]|nr:hypothetical protein [Planctomycetota bacterium]
MISAEPRRELYADFPHVQSEPYWSALFTMYPSSPLVAAAGLRLAQLHLRRGETNAAAQTLAQLHSMPGVSSGAASRPAQTTLLQPLPVEAGLDYDPAPYLLEARRLEELIRENRDDPIHGNQPLTELAGLDPRRARYREGLARLAATYHDSSLWDNLAVLWVCAAPEASERAALLEEALLALPLQDARAQALFSLAELEIPTPATETTDYRRVGMDRLREVVRTFPRTSWADEAARRLRAMEPISGGQPK